MRRKNNKNLQMAEDDVIFQVFCLVLELRKGLLIEADGMEKKKSEEEVSIVCMEAPAS